MRMPRCSCAIIPTLTTPTLPPASLFTSSARFLLWFGGIHGDKQLGMSQVQKTADNGHYLRPFAKILLALSARREKQEALARKNLKELTEEFPGNSVYDSEYAKALGRPIPATIGPAN